MSVDQFNGSGHHFNGSRHAPPRESSFEAARDSGRESSRVFGREIGDEPMERIRELLFGEMARNWDARLQTLETRLQTLEDKLDALKHESVADRQGQLAALAEGIDSLGQHVRRLTRG